MKRIFLYAVLMICTCNAMWSCKATVATRPETVVVARPASLGQIIYGLKVIGIIAAGGMCKGPEPGLFPVTTGRGRLVGGNNPNMAGIGRKATGDSAF